MVVHLAPTKDTVTRRIFSSSLAFAWLLEPAGRPRQSGCSLVDILRWWHIIWTRNAWRQRSIVRYIISVLWQRTLPLLVQNPLSRGRMVRIMNAFCLALGQPRSAKSRNCPESVAGHRHPRRGQGPARCSRCPAPTSPAAPGNGLHAG
jgi:hypothetical protein